MQDVSFEKNTQNRSHGKDALLCLLASVVERAGIKGAIFPTTVGKFPTTVGRVQLRFQCIIHSSVA